jgi:HAD superfamily hydrolase (TIGR01509 family)
MHPEFLYFDLGKVLVDFDIQRMLRQIGEVSGVEPARVKQAVFDSGLQQQYETGQVSSREFYDAFCRQTGTLPDYQSLHRAGNEIFELNLSLLPVVAHLTQAGYRLGILSNTCEGHWQHCRQRFRIVAEPFSVYALSCQIGVTKPEAAIFHKAAELAGVRPQGIFYVDDLPQHVASARAVGFDAVQYTSTPQLVADLRTRGIRLNY